MGLSAECHRLAECRSAGEVMRHILLMEAEVQLKVVVVLWHWWNERNRVREGEKKGETSKISLL